MRRFTMRSFTFTSGLLILAMAVSAQTKAGGGVPHTKDGKVDLSGIWMPEAKLTGDLTKALKPGDKITMLPAADKMMKEHKPKSDPAARCLPMGPTRLAAAPIKIVQTP